MSSGGRAKSASYVTRVLSVRKRALDRRGELESIFDPAPPLAGIDLAPANHALDLLYTLE